MANSVDPDQTAPIGAVFSGSTLFASILNLSVILGNYLQQTTSADDIFLGALRVNRYLFTYVRVEQAVLSKLQRYHCSHTTTAIWVSSFIPVLR